MKPIRMQGLGVFMVVGHARPSVGEVLEKLFGGAGRRCICHRLAILRMSKKLFAGT